ncbi:MAG: poly-gamma-glutamate synthase PgsB [Synechococcus sp. WH 8007]|nr:poly-gamma-glutamate synthase PgsB [Synechococcus sp. WH 8007]
MITYILCLLAVTLFVKDAVHRHYYNLRISAVPIRIHINGIRGKTSLTRYLAAILRNSGYKVFAKTTGTSARIIDELGGEMSIYRPGKPNISEQLRIMTYFLDQRPDAVVVECMAVNPSYSKYLEKKIMNSNIYIFSNVYIDHVDQLGFSLQQIAESMCEGFPSNSVILTTESNQAVLDILHHHAARRNSRIINANDTDYSFEDLSSFNHVPVLQNVKLCLAFAALLQIPRHKALSSIENCNFDEGQSSVTTIPHRLANVQFANLFAVNDIDTFELKVDELRVLYPTHNACVLLNNRLDRYERVGLFLNSILKLKISYVVSLGQCGSQVSSFCRANSIDCLRIDESVPETRSLNGKELIDIIVSFLPSFHDSMLIGSVNIHTKQSHRILEYIESL